MIFGQAEDPTILLSGVYSRRPIPQMQNEKYRSVFFVVVFAIMKTWKFHILSH